MKLKADDGTPLEVKEASIVNEEGEVIVEADAPSRTSGSSPFGTYSFGTGNGQSGRIKVFKLSGWMIPVGILVTIALFTLGTLFFGVFFVGALAILFARTVLRMFKI